jgi:hypothetical protein
MRTIKKAQNGAKTADSTSYFKGRAKDMARQSLYAEAKGDKKLSNVYMDVASKATSDAERQKLKGKPGYDKNGFPLKKKKAQNGATTTPKKTWQQMSAGEKGAKKKELVEKGGIQLFNKYKDSIGKEAMGRIQGEFNKGASSMGMTPEQYSRYLDKQKKKPDTNTSSSDFKEKRYNVVCGKGGCKKNGGSIKKAKSGTTIAKAKDGMWMQKAAASIKRRGTAGKCTPITKPGCTGKAKALAKTFKKIAKSNKKK